MVSKSIWNAAISLLQDLNPEATQSELESMANRGFSMSLSPGEYICNILGV